MTKQEIGELIQLLKDQIVYLKLELDKSREEKENLQKQVVRLQDGIMAVRSPRAYMDMRNDVLGEPTPSHSPEDKQRLETMKKVQDTFLREIEGNTFKTAEELDDLLEGVLRKSAMKSKSIHSNTES